MARQLIPAILAYLNAQATLTAVVGTNIWAGEDPPQGYEPGADGPGVLINTRGGTVSYENGLFDPSVQIVTYGETLQDGLDAYEAVFDVLQDADTYPIASARVEVTEQMLRDPETQWPRWLSYWNVTIVNEEI